MNVSMNKLESNIMTRISEITKDNESLIQDLSSFKKQISNEITFIKTFCDVALSKVQEEQTNILTICTSNSDKINKIENNLKTVKTSLSKKINSQICSLKLNSIASNDITTLSPFSVNTNGTNFQWEKY